MDSLTLAKKIVTILDEKKGEDIRVIKISDLSVITDYFVIAGGTSNTHIKALADEVEYVLSKEEGKKPDRVEGYQTASWILIDYGTVIVHLFCGDTRDFYDLERLWADGEEIDIQSILK